LSEKLICIGKILSPHGVKGELKVLPYTDFPERYRYLKRIRIQKTTEGKESIRIFDVEGIRPQKDIWLLKLNDINTREIAQELRGKYLYILSEERMPLPEDTYYYDQIIGLNVYTVEGIYLGKVKDILPTGGQDTYLVIDEINNKQYLIPAVKSFLPEINLTEGRMTVDPPEGLLDL